MNKEIAEMISNLLVSAEDMKYQCTRKESQNPCANARSVALVYASGYLKSMAEDYGDEMLSIQDLANILEGLANVDYDKFK